MLLSIFTIFCYSGAGILSAISERVQRLRISTLLLGIAAVIFHGLLLHHWIDIFPGQNLASVNMLSLMVWMLALLAIVLCCFWRIDLLLMSIFPLAAFTIIVRLLSSSYLIVDTKTSMASLFHIIFAVMTVSVLCLAALQAILLAIQDRLLYLKKENKLIQRLPSLETMEHLLFRTIAIGFVMLTLLIGSSFYFYFNLLWQHTILLQKTIIVMIAWGLLAVLLLGRTFLGWRGLRAIYFTLFGVSLSLVTYFISQLVLEAIH